MRGFLRGVEIEEVAHKTPDKILKVTIDPVTGMGGFHARRLAFALGLEGMDSIMLDPTWDSRRSGDSQKCGTEQLDGGYRVKCPPGQNVGEGTVTADGASVVMEWDKASKFRGRVLLPCGRQPRFEFAGRVSCSQRYF